MGRTGSSLCGLPPFLPVAAGEVPDDGQRRDPVIVDVHPTDSIPVMMARLIIRDVLWLSRLVERTTFFPKVAANAAPTLAANSGVIS